MTSISQSGTKKQERNLKRLLEQGLFQRKTREKCPVCGHLSFSIKKDRTLAKCFHPSCGFYTTIWAGNNTTVYTDIYNILNEFFHICHKHLLDLSEQKGMNAYDYCIRERHIHPDVLRDSLIGALPEYKKWKPVIKKRFDEVLEKYRKKYTVKLEEFKITHEEFVLILNMKKTNSKLMKKEGQALKYIEQDYNDLEILTKHQKKITDIITDRYTGWLMFFYTDSRHNIKSIRLRKPYSDSRACITFKPFSWAGYFNHSLFSPSGTRNKKIKQLESQILLFEGEFNNLQFQSLAKRAEFGYINSCSWGSASSLNPEELQKTAQEAGWNYVICYDNDQAGEMVITKLREHPYKNIDIEQFSNFLKSVSFYAFTTPWEGSDIDSYICSYFQKTEDWKNLEIIRQAWDGVKALYGAKEKVNWKPKNADFAKKCDSKGNVKLILPIVGDYFLGTENLISRSSKLNNIGIIYRYDRGFYSVGNSYLRRKIQELLGNDTSITRIKEILKYIEIEKSDFFQHDQNGNCIIEGMDPQATDFINLKNGMLEWRTLTLHPHDPKYLSFLRIPVEFNEQAECPEIDRFLGTTFEPEIIPLIEEIAGYLLLPELENQKFILLFGEGGNGKTKLLQLFEALVDSRNTAHVSLSKLLKNRFATAELLGKLLTCGKEVSGYFGNEETDILKTLTGEDRIRAELKFQDSFSFLNHSKLIFTSNDLPIFSAKGFGLYRRMLIIPFFHKFTGKNRDPKLGEKITQPKEISGFLNRALSGLIRLKFQNGGEFTEPDSVKLALSKYKEKNDNLTFFVSESLEITENEEDFISSMDLHKTYKDFCENMNLGKACGMNKLKPRLTAIDPKIQFIYGQEIDGKRKNGYSHLRYAIGRR